MMEKRLCAALRGSRSLFLPKNEEEQALKDSPTSPNISPYAFWHIFFALLDYRTPKPVTELMVFPDCIGKPALYVCPRCLITMEREFMAFCDRCGQSLSWKNYKKAKIVYPGAHRLSRR